MRPPNPVPNTATLRVGGGAVGFNWLPVIVAERQGMFARRNLAVDIKRLGAVDKVTAAVKNGELDLAITPPEGAIRDCAGGGNLRIIAGNVNRLPLSLIANPRIRRIEDLRGARLGTSSLTEGTALYTMEVLRQHGLNYPGDYEFAVVGVHPARWKALQEGTIDAAVQLIPLNFVGEDAGYSNLGEVTDYISEIVFTGLIVDRAAAERRRNQIVAFLSAVIEGTRWVYDPANDETLLALTKELTQAEGKYGRQALDYMREKRVFSTDLSIPDAAFAKSIELMQKAGLGRRAARGNRESRPRRQLSRCGVERALSDGGASFRLRARCKDRGTHRLRRVLSAPHICEIAQYRPRLDPVRQGRLPAAASVCSADDGDGAGCSVRFDFGALSALRFGRRRDRASGRGLRHWPQPRPDVAVAAPGHRIHAVLGHRLPVRRLSAVSPGGRNMLSVS